MKEAKETIAVCDRDCFNCPYPDCFESKKKLAMTYQKSPEKAEKIYGEELKKFLDPDGETLGTKQEKEPKPKKERHRKSFEEIAAREREYYQAHRDERLAYQKDYYEANKDKIKEYQKDYREKNREKIVAMRKSVRSERKERYNGDGKSIKEARKKCGYTQAQLAEMMNLSRQTIAMYESGELRPPLKKIKTFLPCLMDATIDGGVVFD